MANQYEPPSLTVLGELTDYTQARIPLRTYPRRVDIQDLAIRLRRLRRHLDDTGNRQPAGWSALSHRYDFLLSQAGEMLGLRGAPGRLMLTHEARAGLERHLARRWLRRPLRGGRVGVTLVIPGTKT